MRISREEVFGPVANVIRVKDYDEALAIANDTEFGLSSGICTSSLKYATHFKRNSEAGMVMVNLPTAGVDYHVPVRRPEGLELRPARAGRLCPRVLHDGQDRLHLRGLTDGRYTAGDRSQLKEAPLATAGPHAFRPVRLSASTPLQRRLRMRAMETAQDRAGPWSE